MPSQQPNRPATGNQNGQGEPELSLLYRDIDEKNLLLSLNNDIATIRNRKDILQVIQPKLRDLFQTDDIFICAIDSAKRTLSPFIRVAGGTRRDNKTYDTVLNGHFPITDPFIGRMIGAAEPIISELHEFLKPDPVPDYVTISLQCGLSEALSAVLFSGLEPIGVLTLWAEKRGAFTLHHKELIARVAHQVSIVVTNITDNEKIRQREKENEILLHLGNEIANIRSREDLSAFLSGTLKKYLPFDDAVISLFNPRTNSYSVYAHHVETKRLADPAFQAALQLEYPVEETSAVFTTKPVVLDTDELLVNGNNHVCNLRDAGIREYAVIKLVDGNKVIGLLALLCEKKGRLTESSLTIFHRVSYPLSINIAKLEAMHEISNREKEKEILLTIGSDLAAIREKEELLPVLQKQFEKLDFYSDVTIAKVDEDNKTFSGFVVNEDAPRRNDKEYPEMRRAHHPFPDGVFEVALQAKKVVFFDVEKIGPLPETPSYIKFLHKNGIVDIAAISLRNRNEEFGALFLFSMQKMRFSELQLNLVEGIANLLSTAIANILANEKITAQLEEINRYKEQLEEEKEYLQKEVGNKFTSYEDIIGNGQEIQKVFLQLSQVAFANSTVLIQGETGTGKELVARAIHYSSPRKDKLLVKVNCATLPASLVESELFGHEKGSFTGATERRIGKFELANNGTLFLDEIGEMPVDLQVKLLRVLQEKEFERIGGKNTIRVNVRLIAATNRNLQKEIEQGRFRQDLYYRLNVFPIQLPPLRDRQEDIPLLVSHFIERYSKNTGKNISNISGKAMKELLAYHWPGNVRELEHLIERSVLTTSGTTIREVHLPVAAKNDASINGERLKTFEENERDHIIAVLNRCNGKIFGPGGAAAILDMRVSTLNSRMKKLGIKKNNLYS